MDRKFSSSHMQSNRTSWNFSVRRPGNIFVSSFSHWPDFFQPHDNFRGVGAAVLLSVRPLWTAGRNLGLALRMIPRDAFIPRLIVLLVLVLTAVAGTAEITGDWNVDAVAYHLLGPTVWLREGVIRPVLDNSTTAFPQIPETLFAVLLAVGGSRAPDFSSWLTLGLLLLISAGLAMRMGLSATQAWWVAAIVATMPAVYAVRTIVSWTDYLPRLYSPPRASALTQNASGSGRSSEFSAA
jgi:hypothetical protein